jgi:hypothetical protein
MGFPVCTPLTAFKLGSGSAQTLCPRTPLQDDFRRITPAFVTPFPAITPTSDPVALESDNQISSFTQKARVGSQNVENPNGEIHGRVTLGRIVRFGLQFLLGVCSSRAVPLLFG